ncbi:MAG: helix-turn-helix domain-containing protein [Kiritimatiellae bacterium]|nr:helix-turn-helix domain-containing protein [Kiritimatiellia bacterium]
MEFGKTLRAAREARGKTIEEIARETRLMSQIISDLENENMSRIAAPIYGRGFVKLYCEAIGLEAKPMIDQFMNIYNGNHEPIILEKNDSESEPSITEPDLLSPTLPTEEPAISRYSAPISEGSLPSMPTINPAVWRIAIVAVVGIAIIWLICKIFMALFSLSTSAPSPEEPRIIHETEPREQVEIPALYID